MRNLNFTRNKKHKRRKILKEFKKLSQSEELYGNLIKNKIIRNLSKNYF